MTWRWLAVIPAATMVGGVLTWALAVGAERGRLLDHVTNEDVHIEQSEALAREARLSKIESRLGNLETELTSISIGQEHILETVLSNADTLRGIKQTVRE